MVNSDDGGRNKYDVLYSKLLRLFRIDYMFTSLRLGVMRRTEQLIYYYIKVTWASAVCYCQATWFQVGDRVHLERDCIIFPSPPFGTAFGFVLAAPRF